jgi:hypothetical protein
LMMMFLNFKDFSSGFSLTKPRFDQIHLMMKSLTKPPFLVDFPMTFP